MTPLRQRMLEDMEIRNLCLNTQRSYLQQVSSFATTARYLKVATTTVCATTSPFDLLPKPEATEPAPAPPAYF